MLRKQIKMRDTIDVLQWTVSVVCSDPPGNWKCLTHNNTVKAFLEINV